MCWIIQVTQVTPSVPVGRGRPHRAKVRSSALTHWRFAASIRKTEFPLLRHRFLHCAADIRGYTALAPRYVGVSAAYHHAPQDVMTGENPQRVHPRPVLRAVRLDLGGRATASSAPKYVKSAAQITC